MSRVVVNTGICGELNQRRKTRGTGGLREADYYMFFYFAHSIARRIGTSIRLDAQLRDLCLAASKAFSPAFRCLILFTASVA